METNHTNGASTCKAGNGFAQLQVPLTQELMEQSMVKSLNPLLQQLTRVEQNIALLLARPGRINSDYSSPVFSRQMSPFSLSAEADQSNRHSAMSSLEQINATEDIQATEFRSESSRDLDMQTKKSMAAIQDIEEHFECKDERTLADDVAEAIILQTQMAELGDSHSILSAKTLELLVVLVKWWDSLVEPSHKNSFSRIVESQKFEFLCLFVVFCHSIWVAYSTDWQMKNLSESPSRHFKTLHDFFLFFYVAELILRLVVHRAYFFVNIDMKWNIYDLVLVGVSMADFVAAHDTGRGGDNNITCLRILRLCRLHRITKRIRVLKFFKDLAVLVESVRGSVVALFWTMVAMMGALFIFSLFFLQAIAAFMKEEERDDEIREAAVSAFGSLSRTMLTLYMSITGGEDWYKFYKILFLAGKTYAAFFVFFIFFGYLIMLNILNGMFVEKAVAAAMPDRDDLILEQRSKSRQESIEFHRLCKYLDTEGNGHISWQVFQQHMENHAMVAYMGTLGLQVHEVELFFHTVAGAADHGEVPVERFVHACMQMKGVASAIDMQRQLFETHLLHKDLQRFEQKSLKGLKFCMRRIEEVAAKCANIETRSADTETTPRCSNLLVL